MPNIIQIDDSFTDLALNATLHGRVPTVTNISSAWGVEGASTNIVGGGNGDIKFANSGTACKVRSSGTDKAVQIELRAQSQSEFYSIFLRDFYATVYPVKGYILSVQPRASETYGTFSYGTIGVASNYTVSYIQENVQWPFNSGLNIVAFEAISTSFRVIINGQVAASFTNSDHAYNANATRDGIVCHNMGTGAGRVERYTVYDSIDINPAPQYPVVFFG